MDKIIPVIYLAGSPLRPTGISLRLHPAPLLLWNTPVSHQAWSTFLSLKGTTRQGDKSNRGIIPGPNWRNPRTTHDRYRDWVFDNPKVYSDTSISDGLVYLNRKSLQFFCGNSSLKNLREPRNTQMPVVTKSTAGEGHHHIILKSRHLLPAQYLT